MKKGKIILIEVVILLALAMSQVLAQNQEITSNTHASTKSFSKPVSATAGQIISADIHISKQTSNWAVLSSNDFNQQSQEGVIQGAKMVIISPTKFIESFDKLIPGDPYTLDKYTGYGADSATNTFTKRENLFMEGYEYSNVPYIEFDGQKEYLLMYEYEPVLLIINNNNKANQANQVEQVNQAEQANQANQIEQANQPNQNNQNKALNHNQGLQEFSSKTIVPWNFFVIMPKISNYYVFVKM